MKNICYNHNHLHIGGIGADRIQLFTSGIEKHTQKDFTDSIKEYDNAIKSDKNLEAYFNRS